MSLSLSRLLAAGVFSMAAANVCAHEDATREPLAILDCEHPPEHAMRTIPEPVARWAQLQCTPAGQMLVASEDWMWRYPGSFTDRPFLPAWMSADAAVSPEPRYFKVMTARQAESAEASALEKRFLKSMIELPRSNDAQRIFVFTAQSNLGETFEVNFVYRSDRDIWAVPCAPECRPEQLFHIYRRDQ